MPLTVHPSTSASKARMIPKGTLPLVVPLVVGSLAFAEFAHEYERKQRRARAKATSAQDEEAQHAHVLHEHIVSPWKGAR
ncbi:hypothetical protein Gpo141_00008706 [Globisporangium polare]